MMLCGVDRKEFTNFVCLNSGRGALMMSGGAYRIKGVVSSNYTWPTYNQKRCIFRDESKNLHTLINTGRTDSGAYGHNSSWDIDVTLQAQGALYFWGAYYNSPSGWKFNGSVERVG